MDQKNFRRIKIWNMKQAKEIKKIAIVGAGTMGRGILIEAVSKGFQIVLIDKTRELAEFGCQTALADILSLEKKGKKKTNLPPSVLKERFSQVILISFPNFKKNLVESVDFVIEAVPEDLNLKLRIFKKMDIIFPPKTILASNTSSIPITKLAEATQRPEKVIGLHFMNPVPLIGLVEIIKGQKTSEETYQKTIFLAQRLGKNFITSRDSAGFIVNRLLFSLISQAFKVWEEGVASPEDIDKAMKFACNHPTGPLALADLIGLDVCLAILGVLKDYHGEIFSPPTILKRLVKEGKLGRKSKQGVYSY